MNPKVVKLREEREKNAAKIALLQERNKKIDADIIKIENSEILGMTHEFGLSPDMLYELILASKKTPMPAKPISIETEEENASETESGRAAAFALKIKKAVASSDLEGFADLCGYPVYISLESGDGRELETRNDLIALGSETLFTQKMKDTIAAVQESQLDSYGAGVMMGENGTVVFNDVNGTMMITGINLSD